jgi:23S rRNA pseudouridine2605 synthase
MSPGQNADPRRKLRGERQESDTQPDPLKTSVGYIGADSFTRQRQGPGQSARRGGRGGGRGR